MNKISIDGRNMIHVRDLVIRRNHRDVLQMDTLAIQRGETLGVIGPNGSGKSTFLLALARLLRPSHGDIFYHNKSLRLWNGLEYRRKISFVFQSPLLMDMSVEQNVALGLQFRGLPKADIRERAWKWMKQLGIEALSKRRAGQLSGGEAQRVSLARAFVLEPELLLLDEPFAALDPPTRAKLIQELASLLETNRNTAVFVTHNMSEATRLSHRMAVIIEGTLRQVGAANEIKAQPADDAVRAFLQELPQ